MVNACIGWAMISTTSTFRDPLAIRLPVEPLDLPDVGLHAGFTQRRDGAQHEIGAHVIVVCSGGSADRGQFRWRWRDQELEQESPVV